MHILRTLIPFTVILYLAACVQEVKQSPSAAAPSPTLKTAKSCHTVTDLNKQAFDLYHKGLTSQAKHLLEKALQICPSDAKTHNNLASLLKDEGKYSQAIEHYRQALDITPNLSEAWYGLGEIYYKQGQFPLSLEAHLHACHTDQDYFVTSFQKNG